MKKNVDLWNRQESLLIFETKQAFLPVPQSFHSFCGNKTGFPAC
jgi:hypothetical protein